MMPDRVVLEGSLWLFHIFWNISVITFFLAGLSGLPPILGHPFRGFAVLTPGYHRAGPPGLMYIACLGNIGLPLAPFPCFPARRADIL